MSASNPLNPTDHPAGTRLLLKSCTYASTPIEVTVIEWAPSGKFVKLHYATQDDGGHAWMGSDILCYDVIEILPSAKKLRVVDLSTMTRKEAEAAVDIHFRKLEGIEVALAPKYDGRLPEHVRAANEKLADELHEIASKDPSTLSDEERLKIRLARMKAGLKEISKIRFRVDTYELKPPAETLMTTVFRTQVNVLNILTRGRITKEVIDQLPEDQRVLFVKVDSNNDECLVGKCDKCGCDVRRTTVKGCKFDSWWFNCTNPECVYSLADSRTEGTKPPTWFTPFAGG